jgi:hypothetical protein
MIFVEGNHIPHLQEDASDFFPNFEEWVEGSPICGNAFRFKVVLLKR